MTRPVSAQDLLKLDTRLRVECLQKTERPNQVIWQAGKQDYSEGAIADKEPPPEDVAGKWAVDTLLGNDVGHYGCYSKDTEVLTSSGWKLWPGVTKSDQLAAVNIEDGSIAFEHPKALQAVPFNDSDSMYHVTSQKLDIKVTMDHRMVISSRQKNGVFSDWRFAPAAAIIGKPVRYMTGAVLKDSERKMPKDLPSGVDILSLFKLAGFFYGDGERTHSINPRSVRFRLRLHRKIAYLNSLGFEIKPQGDDRFIIHNEQISRWIHSNFSNTDSKQLPNWIISLPQNVLLALLDGLRNSDGTVKMKTWAFDSCEKDSLDILQAACAVNGIHASFSLNNPNEGEGHENHRPCWRLHFSSRSCHARQESNQKGRTRGGEKSVPYQGFVYCATVSTGALIVRRNDKIVVSGNCLEHPQITLNVIGFPHSVMQQARTHRVGVTFDCQSMRYTGKRIQRLVEKIESPDCIDPYDDILDIFYTRPPGFYTDRKGAKYEVSNVAYKQQLMWHSGSAQRYNMLVADGYAEEHARDQLNFGFRQNFVVSFNLRSALHFLDLRAKRDAQLEIQAMCEAMVPHLRSWSPEIMDYYMNKRYGKARLSP